MARHSASWMGRWGDPSEQIQDLADVLVGTLASGTDDPEAYWARFSERVEAGLRQLVLHFRGAQATLRHADARFIEGRLMMISAQWRAWLDSADRSDPVAFYRRFGDLVVASCWYLLCYPFAAGLRNGTVAGLDRTPFAVELALIEREDGSEVFVPHLPSANDAAERLMRREHLLAVIAAAPQDRMRDTHRATVEAIEALRNDDLTDEHIIQLEDVLDSISDAHLLECTHAGRQRLTAWIREQAIRSAQKLLRAGKGDAARLRAALATPAEQWTFALANGIQRMRVHAEGIQ